MKYKPSEVPTTKARPQVWSDYLLAAVISSTLVAYQHMDRQGIEWGAMQLFLVAGLSQLCVTGVQIVRRTGWLKQHSALRTMLTYVSGFTLVIPATLALMKHSHAARGATLIALALSALILTFVPNTDAGLLQLAVLGWSIPLALHAYQAGHTTLGENSRAGILLALIAWPLFTLAILYQTLISILVNMIQYGWLILGTLSIGWILDLPWAGFWLGVILANRTLDPPNRIYCLSPSREG